MNVLIVDDHEIFRQGLRALLEGRDGIDVVGEASNGRQAIELAQQLHPDVILMDITMPHMNGIDATRRILEHNGATTKVIGLSMHSDPRYATAMLAAGAAAYLPKDAPFEELERAARAVMAGETYAPPETPNKSTDDASDGAGAGAKAGDGAGAFVTLTPREREVLQLLAEGLSVKEMAATLNLSAKTIETHRRQLMMKLDIYSVAELTKYAIRQGLTGTDL